MFRFRLCPPLACLVVLALLPCAPARAEDEEPAITSRSLDLRRFVVPAAPMGPRLSVPPDLFARLESQTDTGIWNASLVTGEESWLPFTRTKVRERVFAWHALAGLMQEASARPDRDGADYEEVEEGLRFIGPEEAVARIMETEAWATRAMAPFVDVDATLTERSGSGERLRALGGARLWPGRWTRVYVQESAVPCIVHWDIEVAQEATTMDPVPRDVHEGQELYMRYHPGEAVSVIEVWSGDVEHREIVRQDLAAIRNIPEANGAAALTYPRSAVQRVFTSLALPCGETALRSIRWRNEGRALDLALSFSAPPSSLPTRSRPGSTSIAALHVGALGDALEYGARDSIRGDWMAQLEQLFEASQLAAEEGGGEPFSYDMTALTAGAIVMTRAPAADLERARELLRAGESRLASRTVSLRALAVPEASFRAALAAGALRSGAPVPDEVIAGFREAGAVEAESVRTPVLVDVRTGFRVGSSIPGLVDFDAEIAQSSAGLHPMTSARFRGLFGEMRLRTASEGMQLDVRAQSAWADSAAGALEVLFRPPVSMKGPAPGDPPRGPAPATKPALLPMLGGGSVRVARSLSFRRGATEEQMLHAYVRGDEVILLLVRLSE